MLLYHILPLVTHSETKLPKLFIYAHFKVAIGKQVQRHATANPITIAELLGKQTKFNNTFNLSMTKREPRRVD